VANNKCPLPNKQTNISTKPNSEVEKHLSHIFPNQLMGRGHLHILLNKLQVSVSDMNWVRVRVRVLILTWMWVFKYSWHILIKT
jgi:hypothetical protein